ncbi:MAG TPA: ABC transporter ATP-binding protein [Desulfuromonadaceae bacterium]
MPIPRLSARIDTFRYPDATVALTDIHLDVLGGEFCGILGSNGSGKTTLLRLLDGMLKEFSGSVLLDGDDIRRLSPRQIYGKVGLVFQNPDRQLFSASVLEDVSFGPLNLGLDEATVRVRVETALDSVGMLGHAAKPVHALSFGQKKRVCIAGVLAMEPELLVLDEPMAGLDPTMQAELADVLADLHDKGITLIISTHDVEFAYQWADTIHVMLQGRCVASLDAYTLPQHGETLAAAGLALPMVIGLHAELVRRGLMTTTPLPRSTAELLTLLHSQEEDISMQASIPARRRTI